VAFVQTWAAMIWDMVAESALFLLIGFFLAGVIRAFLSPQAISSVFGKNSLTQIFKASLIGIPLPLCSCSVLPVAAQLRKSGLSREGTISFLISTPETGVDSIALSYTLLGPILMIARPIAALLTAFVSGLVSLALLPAHDQTPAILPTVGAAVTGDKGPGRRLLSGLHYVATDMFPELAYYLFWGFVLAGLAAALLPADFLGRNLHPWAQYLVVIGIGLPVYVCATSSTPLAAVFLGLGMAPGAVLAFMLIGPATNITALVVQKQILGLRATVIMAVTITVVAVICGIILDATVGGNIRAIFSQGTAMSHGTAWYDIAAGIVMAGFIVYYTLRHYKRKIAKMLR